MPPLLHKLYGAELTCNFATVHPYAPQLTPSSGALPLKITGIEGMSRDQLDLHVSGGGKFVIYQYVISLIVVTFRRNSNIQFVRANESRVARGLGFSLLTLLMGWWGIPWGPIFTAGALWTNFRGGHDVTQAVLNALGSSVQPAQNVADSIGEMR